jgi:hypothetical protein
VEELQQEAAVTEAGGRGGCDEDEKDARGDTQAEEMQQRQRQHTPADASIPQHTSASVSGDMQAEEMRQRQHLCLAHEEAQEEERQVYQLVC